MSDIWIRGNLIKMENSLNPEVNQIYELINGYLEEGKHVKRTLNRLKSNGENSWEELEDYILKKEK